MLLLAFSISIISGILGPFVMWNKLSYFSDSIAHSSILGFILAFFLKLNPIICIVIIAIFFSFLIIKTRKTYSIDVILTILNSTSLVLAILMLSLLQPKGINISEILFGDIIFVNNSQIIISYIFAFTLIILSFFRWKKWLFVTINEDIAKIAGHNVALVKMEFFLFLSIFIALFINIIGALLIASVLVLPASISKIFAKNPYTTIFFAIFISFISVILGIFAAFKLNLQISSSIILVMVGTLITGWFLKYLLTTTLCKART